MDVAGKTAIVTGAAGGIGAAIAAGLIERGATVLLADLDADRLRETADRLGADHLAGDVADDRHIASLIERAGSVDLYVANAGIFQGLGLEADESEWAASWSVNLMAHVRAARALVPSWLERGEGCFASTASAAGLLTQLGSPTYSVTKHAAVGFAEWLAATYGDRGIQVACLCPMGVLTPMAEAGEAAVDANARLGHAAVSAAGEVLSPDVVAAVLLDAIASGTFLALPHQQVATMFARKAADHDQWIAGMQHFRTSLEG